ncbi:MAG TPA: YciI family protein [Chloroflexota bacterium]|jgi:hypothetical protein
MRYLLLICDDEKQMLTATEDQTNAMMEEWGKYTTELQGAGKMLGGERLRPSVDATTARKQNGQVVLSDGPFAETKEQLGGYFVIESADLDEATKWAGKMPHLAYGGAVEVRPIWEMPGMM